MWSLHYFFRLAALAVAALIAGRAAAQDPASANTMEKILNCPNTPTVAIPGPLHPPRTATYW